MARPHRPADDDDPVDQFAVELVLDSQPMRLEGRTLEVAAEALAARGLTYATIADRVGLRDADAVKRLLNTARTRAKRAA